jgi:hypothetical protein
VLKRRQYLHDAVGRKEDGQSHGQGDEPGKKVATPERRR